MNRNAASRSASGPSFHRTGWRKNRGILPLEPTTRCLAIRLTVSSSPTNPGPAADKPGGRGRAGGEDAVVEGADAVHSIVAVADGAQFRVNPFAPGVELEFDPDLAVDRRQLLGEPPESRLDEPVIPAEHRATV